MKMNKHLQVTMTGFKAIGTGMEFSCYTNVKGNIDHAQERTLDGAYSKSIAKHEKEGTMPKMFWNHDSWEPPVGVWIEMAEDEKGLFKRGEMLDSVRGIEIWKGLKKRAIDSFSIGYREVKSQWNSLKECNDLIELDIRESSPVNFACNEESRIVDIKRRIGSGGLVGKADLRILLQQSNSGLSKRQIEKITSDYQPSYDIELGKLEDMLESSLIFK